jgi:hypothetical protein
MFRPTSDGWLSILRIGLSMQVIFYCYSLRKDWNTLFQAHGEGLISRDLAEAILNAQSDLLPRLGWLMQLGDKIGLAENFVLSVVWLLLFSAATFLLIGLFSRVAAVVTWFLFLSTSKSGNLMTYGMDNFAMIGLFYLMLSPLPDARALDYKVWKQRPRDQRALGFFQRVLQIHLCVIYFSSGLAKSLGSSWWNGQSMWRALNSPPFDTIPSDVLLRLTWLLSVLGACVCVLELGYPVFIWRKQAGLIWLGAILLMHIMIGIAMRMYLFALIMIVLNLAAFGCRFFTIANAGTEIGTRQAVDVTPSNP